MPALRHLIRADIIEECRSSVALPFQPGRVGSCRLYKGVRQHRVAVRILQLLFQGSLGKDVIGYFLVKPHRGNCELSAVAAFQNILVG